MLHLWHYEWDRIITLWNHGKGQKIISWNLWLDTAITLRSWLRPDTAFRALWVRPDHQFMRQWVGLCDQLMALQMLHQWHYEWYEIREDDHFMTLRVRQDGQFMTAWTTPNICLLHHQSTFINNIFRSSALFKTAWLRPYAAFMALWWRPDDYFMG